MARSLYSKFVLGIQIFGLLSVLTIATFSSGITRDYLIKDRANALYDEANDIAASCSLMYQGQHQDMDLFFHTIKKCVHLSAHRNMGGQQKRRCDHGQ